LIFLKWHGRGREFESHQVHQNISQTYSPVRVDDKPLTNVKHGASVKVPVKNWFDCTNFSELTIRWSLGTGSGTASLNLEPHQSGTPSVPVRDWKDGDVLNLKFSGWATCWWTNSICRSILGRVRWRRRGAPRQPSRKARIAL
jgi:hypothetical protein